MSFKCEICRIKTRRTGSEKRIFMAKFPLDGDRCKKWVAATGNEDLIYVPIEKLHQLKYVCVKHFATKDFRKKKTRLKKKAVPHIDISPNPLSEEIMKNFPLHVVKDEVMDVSTRDHNYFMRDKQDYYDYSRSSHLFDADCPSDLYEHLYHPQCDDSNCCVSFHNYLIETGC